MVYKLLELSSFMLKDVKNTIEKPNVTFFMLQWHCLPVFLIASLISMVYFLLLSCHLSLLLSSGLQSIHLAAYSLHSHTHSHKQTHTHTQSLRARYAASVKSSRLCKCWLAEARTTLGDRGLKTTSSLLIIPSHLWGEPVACAVSTRPLCWLNVFSPEKDQ